MVRPEKDRKRSWGDLLIGQCVVRLLASMTDQIGLILSERLCLPVVVFRERSPSGSIRGEEISQ